MWLSGMWDPDFYTVNTFRSSYLKDTINHILTQVVLMLVDMGYLTLNTIYMDGTNGIAGESLQFCTAQTG